MTSSKNDGILARLMMPLSAAILLASLTAAVLSDQLVRRNEHAVESMKSNIVFQKPADSNRNKCRIDQSQPPILEELVQCRNSSMFNVWRPKARLLGPRGWMNDPMGIYETKNGSYHIGYQCNPNHLVWSNISQCSASTKDFVYFNDYHSWKNPVTIAPTQLYDIRGVFDGTIIKDGWNGNPSLIYTSVFVGPLSARSNPPEVEGVETQSVAYTEDDGYTWTKLNFGANGNPVIYKWPEQHLSGFRDPFVFQSSEFAEFYSNQTVVHQVSGSSNAPKPSGENFLLLSGGIRTEVDPIHGGPRLFLYRQTEENNIRDWTFLGSLLSSHAELHQSSEWRGAEGINFECGGITQIDEYGVADQKVPRSPTTRLNVITTGTEGGRGEMNYWPIWKAVSWDLNAAERNVKAKVDFAGVIDWGRAYAFTLFQSKNRQLIVGWTYEDDQYNVLTPQRGAQGAFTLFREMFVKIIRNVHPAALKSQEHAPSWTIRLEANGAYSLITVGQKILPEILTAFRKNSIISKLNGRTLSSGNKVDPNRESGLSKNVVPLSKQPTDRYYAISAQLDFFSRQETLSENVDRSTMARGGFRILASENEWTDVFYDPSEEYLVIDRSHSSAISSYGNSTERAKLRLWPILNPATNNTRLEQLNLTIIVDNSVVEVHANEQALITTRVYPWYKNSIGIMYLVEGRPMLVDEVHPARHPPFAVKNNITILPETVGFQSSSVRFSNVEIWDGLLNAWPNRPHDTSLPGVYSHNITSTLYGLWPDL